MKFEKRTLTILSLTLLVSALSATASSVHAPLSAPRSTLGTTTVTDPKSPQLFQITCNPHTLTLTLPGAGSSTCYVTSQNSFAGSVGIAASVEPVPIAGGVCISALGASVGCTTSSAPVIFSLSLLANGTQTFTVSVNTLASDIPWDYSVAFAASSGTEFHTQILEVNTGPSDYIITQSVQSLSIAQGGSGADTITITPTSYTDRVHLLARITPCVQGGLGLSFTGGSDAPGACFSAIVLTTSRTATLNINLPAGVGGSYSVEIQATGGGSQPFDQHTHVLIVNPPLLSSTTLNLPTVTPEAGAPSTFTATTIGGVPPFSYVWHWGDGTADTSTSGAVATHTYAAAGPINGATVTVTDAMSPVPTTIASPAQSVLVVAGLSAATAGCTKVGGGSLAITCTPTQTGGVGPYKYTWAWGDGSALQTTPPPANPVPHTYAVAGTYNVGLTVTDANNVVVHAPTQQIIVP